jgi:hypothetical protein
LIRGENLSVPTIEEREGGGGGDGRGGCGGGGGGGGVGGKGLGEWEAIVCVLRLKVVGAPYQVSFDLY